VNKEKDWANWSSEAWAAKIAKYKEKNGASSEDIATLLGVNVQTVKRWEKRAAKPSGTSAVILAVLLAPAAFTTTGAAALTPGFVGFASAFGIYRVLKDLFESKNEGDSE